MASGPPISPYVFENRDNLGNIDARFEVAFTGTNQTLTGIVAYNVQGSGLTAIQVTHANGSIFTLPLPTSGRKVTVNVDGPTGPPPVPISVFTATITQAQINNPSAFVQPNPPGGFTVFYDIAGYTLL